MAFDKKGTFTLGKNKRREKDTHPEYSGTLIDEDGNEFWLSAWIKEHNGEKFFSGRIKRKEQKGPEKKPQSMYDDPLNDEIPF